MSDSDDQIDSDEYRRQKIQHAKRLKLLKYIEAENENLINENQDLNQTLKINKQIIASFMMSDNPDIEFAIGKV